MRRAGIEPATSDFVDPRSHPTELPTQNWCCKNCCCVNRSRIRKSTVSMIEAAIDFRMRAGRGSRRPILTITDHALPLSYAFTAAAMTSRTAGYTHNARRLLPKQQAARVKITTAFRAHVGRIRSSAPPFKGAANSNCPSCDLFGFQIFKELSHLAFNIEPMVTPRCGRLYYAGRNAIYFRIRHFKMHGPECKKPGR